MLPSVMHRTSPAERFWAKVVRGGPSECWEWTAYKLNGYGRFGSGGRSGSIVYAHRWAYEALVGPIPEGLTIDHLCRNRGCVNPAHMEPVTGAVNSLRGFSPPAVNARKTHCPYGHPYDTDNLINRSNGYRVCRECNRLRCLARARAKGVVPAADRLTCKSGHPWTPENTYYEASGRRHCRECMREYQRQYHARKRERAS